MAEHPIDQVVFELARMFELERVCPTGILDYLAIRRWKRFHETPRANIVDNTVFASQEQERRHADELGRPFELAIEMCARNEEPGGGLAQRKCIASQISEPAR